MQARPPPMNVILYVIQYTEVLVLKENIHRSVNPRHTCISDTLGQGGEPTLRLPFICIGSPYIWIPIGVGDRYDNLRTLL